MLDLAPEYPEFLSPKISSTGCQDNSSHVKGGPCLYTRHACIDRKVTDPGNGSV